MSKQYGLILPNKDKGHKVQGLVARPKIFDNDSDSETETLRPTGITKIVKKQVEINQQKAVEEDPTVFQYDEVYDEMDKKRKDSKLARKDLDKKPKYINRLLATAERRKRENERRIERQVQKEREAEGEEFKDKESFVTSAYKKKLEELKALEEQEKREEYLESIGDVRKQGNLDGFYRHLYDQKVLYEEKTEEPEVKKEAQSESEEEAGGSKSKTEKEKSDDKKAEKKRKYRQRKDSKNASDENESAEEEIKKEHLPSNLDADSDFSIDSSDSDGEDGPKKEKLPKTAETTEPIIKTEDSSVTNEPQAEESKAETDVKEKEDKENDESDKEKPKEEVKKPKVDIWKKRTVGEVFDEALRRYFERKALRESGN